MPVDAASKIPMFYAFGSILMASSTLLPALLYYRNRRDIRRYDAEILRPHPQREAVV